MYGSYSYNYKLQIYKLKWFGYIYGLGYYGREICFKIDNVAWGKPQKNKKAVPAHLTSRCCRVGS
jgi:hypothetical protein